MKLSVLIPTYRRGDDLTRCLLALRRQIRPVDEVVVVHRPEDEITKAILANELAKRGLPLKPAVVRVAGQVAALNVGMAVAQGDIICITDDDAAPHVDWLRRIEDHFASDERIAGVGGRDWVHHSGSIVHGSAGVVGSIQLVGRHVGNHHIGTGGARDVDILKGANMSYRRAALTGICFDGRLIGTGAQVGNDMMFSLTLRRRGWRLVYDPAVAVDHFPSVRHDFDQRSSSSAIATRNRAHNETLAVLEFIPGWRVPLFITWAFLIGTPDAPGLIQALRLQIGKPRTTSNPLISAISGRAAGIRTWLRGR